MSPEPVPPAWQPTMLVPRRDVGSELPPGTRLQDYVIESLVGVGGFSIVYRARDLRLGRAVALKEYIPAALATRGPGGQVVARGPRHAPHFEAGLAGFINEARLLAAFDHPALVKVFHFWAANGSAYMVMPFYEGLTLRKWLVSLGTPPSEAWLRALAEELTGALDVLHRERCFHRDVAPDNVLLLVDPRAGRYLEQRPRPLLLDFGAARRVISEATQDLTAILKPGYSPIEQYAGEVAMRQGPWTDVYALAAVLYLAAVGRVPPSSIARAARDDLVPARVAAAGRYSEAFLAAIDAGLAVSPQARPQSMAEFAGRLSGLVMPPPPPPPPPPLPLPSPPPSTAPGAAATWPARAAAWWRRHFR
ncbi:MAG: serine/threonine-protein kinase [Rubrivivax sp.]